MLSTSHRFHGYGSLRRVYQNGQTVRGPLLGLRFAPRRSGQQYRMAVVVSRKVHKSAVRRNRIRRRLYEIVRQLPEVPEETDLVFTVFSDQIAKVSTTDLRDMVSQLLQKAEQRRKSVA